MSSVYSVRPISSEARSRLDADRHGTRRRSPFQSSWSSTRQTLATELKRLARPGRQPVLMVDVDESQIRLDGELYARATPRTPDVAVAVESPKGDLLFTCGRFTHWNDNVRAIALGLEALRKVERYGIVQSDEQYRGWQALPPGVPMPAAQPNLEEAWQELWRYSGLPGRETEPTQSNFRHAYRQAMSVWHPDKPTGDAEVAQRINELWDLLGGAA